METLHTPLPSMASANPDAQRRARNVVIIGIGLVVLVLVMIPIAIAQGAPPAGPLILGGASVIFVAAVTLARSGRVALGASLLIGVTLCGNLAILVLDPSTPSLPFFLVLSILLATVLLPPIQIWSVLTVCLLGNAFAASLFAPERRADEIWSEAVVNSSLLMVAVAVIGYLSASGVRAALVQAETARDEAEAARKALQSANASLEQRVEERTVALRQIADEHRAAAAELRASLDAQQELNRIVADLAVPVIPVSASTLVVPLVGNIDGSRADQVLGAVLGHVERAGARTVVLDVTGVAVVDTHVAATLLQVAHATRLMGAETVLAGIRPEVAQALVGLGADLRNLRTVATLQEAL